MEAPRWLADEMLGRLARYLRFLGHDTLYVRDRTDAEIRDLARAEGRRLLTRDRDLAARTPRAVLLTSPDLDEQLRGLRTEFPHLSYEVRFDRCTACNGRLDPIPPSAGGAAAPPRPARLGANLPLYRCAACGHLYWEGSHTARIRERLRSALGPP